MTLRLHPAVIGLVAASALAQTPAGQNVERTLYFSQTDTREGMLDIVNGIRAITDIPATIDPAQRTLTLNGAVDRVAVAEQLFNELDKPPGSHPPGARSDYQWPGNTGEIVRVLYAHHAASSQGFRDTVNIMRALADLPRLMPCLSQQAIILRSSPDQAGLAEWLLDALNRPAGQAGDPNPPQYRLRLPRGGEAVARVFYLTHAQNSESLTQITDNLRSATRIERLFSAREPQAIAMRGTDAEIAQAAQLIQQLDR
jgi:hypothetical protein